MLLQYRNRPKEGFSTWFFFFFCGSKTNYFWSKKRWGPLINIYNVPISKQQQYRYRWISIMVLFSIILLPFCIQTTEHCVLWESLSLFLLAQQHNTSFFHLSNALQRNYCYVIKKTFWHLLPTTEVRIQSWANFKI